MDSISNSRSLSKVQSKQLSFFQSMDDEEEEEDYEEEEDKSNAKVIAKTIDKSKNLCSHRNSTLCNQSTAQDNGRGGASNLKAAPEADFKHDDASSTSSCSCEDHPSPTKNSDEDENLHGDLDYDEDSITDSPKHCSTNSRTKNVAHVAKRVSPDTSAANSGATKSITNEQQNRLTCRIDEPETIQIDSGDESVEEEPKRRKESNGKQPSKSRIRSFINFPSEEQDEGDEDKTTKSDTALMKDRSHKSYQGLLKYFFKDACYFQIKSINHENVEISKRLRIWSTPLQNEVRLNTAFREHRNVILIFSVQQSGSFQGFARMVSEAEPAAGPLPWVIPERLSKTPLGGIFQVEWLCVNELAFPDVRELHNPFNDNKPIKIARDGQQVEPQVGKKLCLLFPEDSKKRLLSAIETLKRQARQRKQSTSNRNSYYPMNGFSSRDAGYLRTYPYPHHLVPQPSHLNGYDAGMVVAHPASSHRAHGYDLLQGPHALQVPPYGVAPGGPAGRHRRLSDRLGSQVMYPHPSHQLHSSSLRRNGTQMLDHYDPLFADGPPHSLLQGGAPNDFHSHNLGYGYVAQPPYGDRWFDPYQMDVSQHHPPNRFHPYQRSRR